MQDAGPATATSARSLLVRPWRDRALRRKLIGFAAVSVVALPVAQITLWMCYSVVGMAAVPANIIAVAVGAVPSYWLNRRWVWRRSGDHSLSREILPFWTYTLLGLLLSTVFVAIADRTWGTSIAVGLANIAGFGVLWVGKFLLLERVLFVERAEPRVTP